MNTTTRKAIDLQLGDRLTTVDGKVREVTGIDVTPAAVRIRTGRSQHWMRSSREALFTVVAR